MRKSQRTVWREAGERWDEYMSVSAAAALCLLPRRLPAADSRRAAAVGAAAGVAASLAECRGPPWRYFERSLTLPTVAPAPETSEGRRAPLSAAAARQRAVSFVADRGSTELRHSQVAKRHTGDAAHYSLRTRWAQRPPVAASTGRREEIAPLLPTLDAPAPVAASGGSDALRSHPDAGSRRETTYYNECVAELLGRKLSHLLDEQHFDARRTRQRASRARIRKLGVGDGGGGLGGVVGPLDRTMQLLEEIRRQRLAPQRLIVAEPC